MEFAKSDSTNFLLYSEWARDKGISEAEYEKVKFSLTPVLEIVQERIKMRHELSRELNKINSKFREIETHICEFNEYGIEIEESTLENINSIHNELQNDAEITVRMITALDNEVIETIAKAEQITKELKSKLKQCLNKNLPRTNDNMLDMLFEAKDAHEIADFFEIKDDFLAQSKTKVKQQSAILAFEILAKAGAIKSVDELLTDKNRQKEIKNHLKSVKPCIKECSELLTNFITDNNKGTTHEQSQILASLSDKSSYLDKALDQEKINKLEREKANKRSDEFVISSEKQIKSQPERDSSRIVNKR